MSDANQIQMFKLILIGLAVSVPLAIAILVVSSRFSAPAQSQARVDISGTPAERVQQSDDKLVSDSPHEASPATPVANETEPDRTESGPPPEAVNDVEPATPVDDQQTFAPPAPAEGEAAETEPVAPATTTELETAPNATPASDSNPPQSQTSRETPPVKSWPRSE